MTNGDKIRSMTDMELAKIIVCNDIAERIPFCQSLPECVEIVDRDVFTTIPEELCQKCALKWLEQEAPK